MAKRKYPVSLKEYTENLKKDFKKMGFKWNPNISSIDIEAKYYKACYVYDDMKKNFTTWKDSDFGILKNPEDAFLINWDI